MRGILEKVRFALDSPLEGDGFELPVPREKGWSFDGSLSSAPFKSPRVSTKTTRLLHEGPMVRIRLPPPASQSVTISSAPATGTGLRLTKGAELPTWRRSVYGCSTLPERVRAAASAGLRVREALAAPLHGSGRPPAPQSLTTNRDSCSQWI